MFKLCIIKSLFISSIFLLSLVFVSLTVQQVEASEASESSESIVNPDEPSKPKSPLQSEDSVYEETGGLYTEEDFKNAIPADETLDYSPELNPPSETSPKKEENKKQQSAPPTAPIDESFSTKAVVPKTTGKLYFRKNANSGTYVCSASVVNSDQDNAILTAGHCVHGGSAELWYTDFVFVPGYYNGDRYYGNWMWEKVHAPYGL
ncbi:hypothetical protein U2I54_19140 [Bacillus pseudomycoides]|uniref:Peptidase S1 domain-containing protein n=1 Tax=Bacillus bingmayongensis TaxID=1150157 RepID=A0ABU5K075_9BACI|nr:hypothetical protein [Bacillus pseudomycoides]